LAEVKLAWIAEGAVSIVLLGGIGLVAVLHRAAGDEEDRLQRWHEASRAIADLKFALKDFELIHSRVQWSGATGQQEMQEVAAAIAAATARVQQLEPQAQRLLANLSDHVRARQRDIATGGRPTSDTQSAQQRIWKQIAELERDHQALVQDHTRTAQQAKQRVGLVAGTLALLGWPILLWLSRRSRRHQRINAAIMKQLRRYVQDLERAHAIESETAADLMRLNDELAAAKQRAEHAMEARAQFMARISHDIRTPLSGIVGMSQLLMESETNPEYRSYVLAIHSCANSLTRLLNDVLDLSKAESGKVVLTAAPFNLHQLCEEIACLFRAALDEDKVRIEYSYAADAPHWVVGDEQRLRQVITNLVGNAVKFTPAGSVSLSVTSAMTSSGGCRFRIKVTDTGIGIRTGRLSTIFDPYEQGEAGVARRFGGTGLGLSICKHLAELMKGSIEVASVYGEGSVFTLTVPLVPAVASEAPLSPQPARPDDHTSMADGIAILVADDNRVNQTVCRRVLEKLGASVDVVSNGFEAVEACARVRYDLVLVDCNMPELDGYDATLLLRKQPAARGLRIVALTADATPEARRRCFEVGMDDWLLKPLRVESLKRVLQACNAKRGSEPALLLNHAASSHE
jgi:signal transduction histidine kinase/CheY-like chemotaxis protein